MIRGQTVRKKKRKKKVKHNVNTVRASLCSVMTSLITSFGKCPVYISV